MIRINLLPHREEKRRARLVQFVALSVISAVLGILAVASVYVAIDTQISYQKSRNDYLRAETAILDKQIQEINKLREDIKALLARKSVVENLQSTRSDVVHLMDQMLKILPEGVYLQSIKQKGNMIALVGYAQSNARVSTLMRAIEDSPWLENPSLVEIRAVSIAQSKGAPPSRLGQFTLNFAMTRTQGDTSSANSAIKTDGGKR